MKQTHTPQKPGSDSYLTNTLVSLASSADFGLCDGQNTLVALGTPLVADNWKSHHLQTALVTCA